MCVCVCTDGVADVTRRERTFITGRCTLIPVVLYVTHYRQSVCSPRSKHVVQVLYIHVLFLYRIKTVSSYTYGKSENTNEHVLSVDTIAHVRERFQNYVFMFLFDDPSWTSDYNNCFDVFSKNSPASVTTTIIMSVGVIAGA